MSYDSSLSAIVLSAGFSSRMGKFKPLLPIGGKTVLERVISIFREGCVNDIVVVTGHRGDEVRAVAESAGARAVENPDYRDGMFSSVKAGVRGIDQGTRAFFVMPADIPLVRPLTVKLVSSAYFENDGKIVYPVFASERGHPPLIPAELKPSVLNSRMNGGLRSVLEAHEKLALELPVPDRNILINMNGPGNYDEVVELAANLDIPTFEECEILLTRTRPVPEKVLRHSRTVEKLSSAICSELIGKGAFLNARLASAAALLHDIAKGLENHAERGAELLRDMGFERVAEVVANHTDLIVSGEPETNESEIVYMADKLAMNDRFVTLEHRFETALERFGKDPEARRAIERRRKTALAVRNKLESRLGRSLESFLAIDPKPARPTADQTDGRSASI